MEKSALKQWGWITWRKIIFQVKFKIYLKWNISNLGGFPPAMSFTSPLLSIFYIINEWSSRRSFITWQTFCFFIHTFCIELLIPIDFGSWQGYKVTDRHGNLVKIILSTLLIIWRGKSHIEDRSTVQKNLFYIWEF